MTTLSTSLDIVDISDGVVTKSSEGSRTIVTEDAADLPLLTLDPVYGESVQDGTPMPDAPQAILSVTPGLISRDVDFEYIGVNSGRTGRRWSNIAFGVRNTSVTHEGHPSIYYHRTGITTDSWSETCFDFYEDRCHFTAPTSGRRIYISLWAKTSDASVWSGELDTVGISLRVFDSSGSKILDREPGIVLNSSTVTTDWKRFEGSFMINTSEAAKMNAPGSRMYFFFSPRRNIDLYLAQFQMSYTTGVDYKNDTSLPIVSSTGSTTYLDMTDPSTGESVELHGLDETYRDILRIDASGHAVVEKKTQDTTLTGALSENWNWWWSSDTNMGPYISLSSIGFSKFSKGYGSYPATIFKNNRFWWVNSGVYSNQKSIYNCSNGACFQIIWEEYDNLTDWRAYLADNPLTIVAPLSESDWYTIDLGYVDLPEVTDGSTVYVAAEVQPVIGGSWWTKAGESAGIAHQDQVRALREMGDLSATYELRFPVTSANATIQVDLYKNGTLCKDEVYWEGRYTTDSASWAAWAAATGTTSTGTKSLSISATNGHVQTIEISVYSDSSKGRLLVTDTVTLVPGLNTRLTATETIANSSYNAHNGFTILWNYENFSTANNGEAYICKMDPFTGTKSDDNGWVMWNGVKRTIAKQRANPNAILPYNIPIYIVCRLSSSSSTTGTNYMVWYNGGWKYASMPTPSAVGGTWTWADATDMILGKFVEPGSEQPFTECEIYQVPLSAKQLTTDTITARSANSAATTAQHYSTAKIATVSSISNGTVVADCPNFSFYAGCMVLLRANNHAMGYAGAVTIKIGNDSARTLYINVGDAVSATDRVIWGANADILLQAGTGAWIVQPVNSGGSLYGYSSTGGSTAAKAVTLSKGAANSTSAATTDFLVFRGTKLTVRFTEANTVANPTVNLNSTGAIALTQGGTALDANYPWYANDSVDMVFTGTQWEVVSHSAARIATDYGTSMFIHPKGDMTKGVRVGTWTYNSKQEVGTSVIHDSKLRAYYGSSIFLFGNANGGNSSAPTYPYLTVKPTGVETYASATEYSKMTSSGFDIYKGGSSVALFAEQARVGRDGYNRFLMNASNLQAYDSSNNLYFQVSKDGMAFGANASSLSSVATTKNVSDAVDNLQIGGRNLLRNTAKPEYKSSDWNKDPATIDGWSRWSSAWSITNTSEGIKGTSTSTRQSGFAIPFAYENAVIGGIEYTLSFDYRTNVTNFGTIYLLCQSGGNVSVTSLSCVASTDAWQHYTQTITWPSTSGKTTRALLIPYFGAENDWFEIRNSSIKLELGNKATDWTPAPEDLETQIENAAKGWYAECPTPAATVAKVATITPAATNFALTAGVVVHVKFSETNSAAVGSITLDVNGTGAKRIQRIYNNSRTNIAGAGYLVADLVYELYYDGTYWIVNDNVDTVDRTRWQNNLAAAEAITSTHIICGTSSGYRNIGAGVAFDLGYPLLYAASSIAKGATTGTLNNNFLQINNVSATANGTVEGAAANATVYLKGTVDGNAFTISASPFLTCTPASAEGHFYIPIGIMYSTTHMYFNSSKDLYAYLDDKFRQVNPTDIVATQKIYYRSSSSSKPSESGLPATWVTTSTNQYATNNTTASKWTTKVTPIADGTGQSVTKYPYLWTCEQRKRLDGTVKYGEITLDDTTTVIDGGKVITGSVTANQLASNSVTADKIAAGAVTTSKLTVTDMTNYCQLNRSTAAQYGWTVVEDSSNPNTPWFQRNTLARDNYPSEWFDCKGGESFRVSMAVSSNVTGATSSGGSGGTYVCINLGIHTVTAGGTSSWPVANIASSSSSATETYATAVVKIPVDAVRFRAFIQIGGWAPFAGTLKIRRPLITKMANAELIVDGSITADKIATNAITIGTVDGLQNALAGKQAAGDYATNAALTSEANARKASYATCETPAGTQAKVATCSNFAIYKGATVTVGFSAANTHATPTLNVNSTGAKAIKGYTGAALTEGEYKWVAGSAITFVYDGANWRMQDGGALQAKIDAASSATAASSSASNAASSASAASSSASTASSKATEASNSATTASNKATEASSSATTASNKASAASASATTASNKASEASASATSAASSAATALDTITVKDTRNDNQNPQWYITNYPKKRVQEFKTSSKIGLSGDTYCWMQTDVPWADSSGGWPKQTVEMGGKQYWRQGTSATAWSDWVDASATATNYIELNPTGGIKIYDSSNSTSYQHQTSSGTDIYVNNTKRTSTDSDGLHIYDSGGNDIGLYGATSRVGSKSSGYIETTSDGVNLHHTSGTEPGRGINFYNGSTKLGEVRTFSSNVTYATDTGTKTVDKGLLFGAEGEGSAALVSADGTEWVAVSNSGLSIAATQVWIQVPAKFRKALGLDTATNIPELPASKITSGALALARGGTGVDNTNRAVNTVFAAPTTAKGNPTWRTLEPSDIPNIGAGKVTSGTFDAARIPTLAASKITGLGTVKTFALGTSSIATGTWAEVRETTSTTRVSLEAGTWIVMLSVSFASNATGRRIALLADSSSATAFTAAVPCSFQAVPVSGGTTKDTVTGVFKPTATTTYYVRAWQSSGGALDVTAHVTAIRIA